ncbi:MAG: TIGR01212 family radical SAM protein [Campylobacteraceae bacterium]
MQLHEVVNTFGNYLLNKYNEKIYKVTLDGGFNCPNRDGTIGRGGCTFCNVSSIIDENISKNSLKEQLSYQTNRMYKSNKYIAYFQAYTSTYSEVTVLKELYKESMAYENIIGLSVGTRPDCVRHEALELLLEFQNIGYEIWLELGLQSANNKTLININRGHSFEDYVKTTKLARNMGIKVCTHLIIGLPNEDKNESINTLNKVLETGVDGLKIHPLHIAKNAPMQKDWQNGKIKILELDEYVDTACDMIRETPKDVIYHRVSANARTLVAPSWCANHWIAMNAIYKNLIQFGAQGSATKDVYGQQ